MINVDSALPLSRLNHAACTLSSVRFAAGVAHALRHTRFRLVAASTGQDSHLPGRIDGFPSWLSVYIASSITKLRLALDFGPATADTIRFVSTAVRKTMPYILIEASTEYQENHGPWGGLERIRVDVSNPQEFETVNQYWGKGYGWTTWKVRVQIDRIDDETTKIHIEYFRDDNQHLFHKYGISEDDFT